MELQREYARFRAIRAMIDLEPNHYWFKFVQRFACDCAEFAITVQGCDPIYYASGAELWKVHGQDLKESHGFTPEIRDRLGKCVIAIIDAIDYSRSEKLEVKLGDTYIIKYGEFQIAIRSEMHDYLKWLYVGREDTFNVDLAILLMRYSFGGLAIDQHSAPMNMYEVLHARGFRIEGFASPINFQLGLIEYRSGSKNRESRYFSLFPDIDCKFGSLGNIRYANLIPGDIVLHPDSRKTSLSKVIDLLLDTSRQVCAILKKQVAGSECIIEMEFLNSSGEVAKVPMKRWIIGYPNSEKLGLSQSSDERLSREWHRLGYINRIANVVMPDRDKYEYLNIIERFLLNMANLINDEQMNGDMVLADLPEDHFIYAKLRSELLEKKLRDNVSEIRVIVAEYLASSVPKSAITYYLTGSGVRIGDDFMKQISIV